MTLTFSVSESWRSAYPGASAGILAMSGVHNPAQHAGLAQRKAELEKMLQERFAGLERAALEALPVMQAYQAYYQRFKKTFHILLQLESVALKGKPIPSVAGLVEAMFMAELKNGLLTAGHDLDILRPPIEVKAAQGNERYVLLRGQETALKAGDMYMEDRQGIISSVLYGPDQRTQITPSTRRVLFAVYAPPGIGKEAVEQHLNEIQENTRLVAPQAEVEAFEVV